MGKPTENGLRISPRMPASLQTNRHEPNRVTWKGRQRLCQCWGHSLTCLHSPHWGAVLQSTHRMLQMQRLQKAVKNKQHFYFISFQQPPQADPCSSSQCSTSPLGSGYPSLCALKALPYITPAPFPQADTKNHKTWSSVTTRRQKHHHLSVLGISALHSCLEPHLGFTTQAAI